MTIFDEIMRQGNKLTESVNMTKKASPKKITYNRLKVESIKIMESDDEEVPNFDVPEGEEVSEDEVVLVIDPEIKEDEEIPEDAAEKLVGDMVYKCPICGANYVCDCNAETNESIDVDENGVPTECPICGDDADQILIGEIAPAEDVKSEDSTEMEPVDSDDAEDEEEKEEEVEEGDSDDEEVEEYEEEDEEVEEESIKRRNLRRAMEAAKRRRRVSEASKVAKRSTRRRTVKESVTDRVEEIKNQILDYIKTHTYDEIAEETGSESPEEVVEALVEMFYDVDDVNDEFINDITDYIDSYGFKKSKRRSSRRESTESTSCKVSESKRTSLRRPTRRVESVDLEFDDTRFNAMINRSVIKENYETTKVVPTFKITKITGKGNTLKFEYVVREGRKITRGQMICEGFNKDTSRMILKIRDKGAFTESLTKTPAFIVECKKTGNKITPVRMSYDFKVRVNESLYRVTNRVANRK